MNIITGLVSIITDLLMLKDTRVKYNSGGHPGRLPKVDERATRKEFQREEMERKRAYKLPLLEFQTLLLTYMMNEDDGKINSKEKHLITENFKQFRGSVSKEDVKRIKTLLKEPNSLQGITKYMALTVLTTEIVTRSIGLLEIINQEEQQYTAIIEQLKQHIMLETDYEL